MFHRTLRGNGSVLSHVRRRRTHSARANAGRAAAMAVALLLASATVLAAHDTWLLPSQFYVEPGQPVRFNLTSGERFPVDDFAIDLPRISRADVRLSDKTMSLGQPQKVGGATVFTWQPPRIGVATVMVELKPRVLTLAPDKINEYFDEIDASPAMRAEWKARKPGTQWREEYTKHVKSFIRVGPPMIDTSWRATMGGGLEIVPEREPTSLRARDTLTVRVMQNGKPKARFAVGAIGENETKAVFFRTDANGRAKISLPKGGRWLLNGTDLRATKRAGLEWESDFTTLTVFVQK